ncbi:cysteine proteinase [Phaeosphaeriaceae sp. SRC1lsM3a]|nr:cysteine proteinase [Stagonospora sp. SRC1lsM3a]
MSDHAFTVFDDLHRLSGTAESSVSLTWVLITVVVGAYILVYALQNLGYPLRLWAAQLLDMAAGLLRLSPISFPSSSDAPANDATMQRAGGLLNSLIGLSSDSLLQKSVRSFTSALSSGPSTVPPGLGNISNSCYQNSIIQGFSALPSLRNYLSDITSEHASLSSETTNGALHDLITKLNNPANAGQNFWIRGKLKSMTTFTQQDAQEYYSKILDEMDNEVKKISSSKRRSSVSWLVATKGLSGLSIETGDAKLQPDSSVQQELTTAEIFKMAPNPLDGLIAQRVGCTSCGYSEGLSLINFNCITVSLGQNNGYDIRECLDEYTKLEYIDGVECAKCTLLKLQKTLTPLAAANPDSPFAARLHTVTKLLDEEKFDDGFLVKDLNIAKKNWVQSSKSKQIVVARAPKSLVLHVNRSIFDEMTGAQYKNSAAVSYPRVLDLGNWCLGGQPSGSQEPDMPLEEWPRDPKQSMLPDTEEPLTTSPFQYTLRAVITHFGSHGNGHYVCYRPHARIVTVSDGTRDDDSTYSNDEEWWRFSDDTVYSVPEQQAHQPNVFMLFYERLDVSNSSQPQGENQTPALHAVAEDAPLPPEDVQCSGILQDTKDTAISVPLPDDDSVDEIVPYPTADIDDITSHNDTVHLGMSTLQHASLEHARSTSPSLDTQTTTNEAGSEDAPSTQLTFDSEAEPLTPPTPKPMVSMPSHAAMRTAGNANGRGQGSRQSRRSLPLVSAT